MLRLIFGTLAARLGEAAALALLAILAVVAATAAPMVAHEAKRRAIETEVEAASPAERAITASGSAGTLEELVGKVRQTGPPASLTLIAGSWRRLSNVDLEIVVYREGVCAHLRLVEGDCSGLVVSAALAEHRAHAIPLVEALREVPPRKGGAGALVLEAAVVALAVAAIVQSTSDPSSDLAVLVPLSVAAVVGVLLARLVPLAASRAGVAWIRRGRLGAGLSTLWLARRPGADRLVALIVIAVGLLVHAAAAWDAARADTAARAAQELGADRVLSVQARSRAALLHAVRTVDPQGLWAMAAARHQDTVAVDSPRLAAIVPSLGGVAQRLRPAANEPIRITAPELPLGITVTTPLPRPIRITVVLDGPSGERITGTVDVDASGTHTVPVPACAAGCRLAWLSFPRSPDELVITRVGPLSTGPVAHAARWRRSVGMEGEVTIFHTAEGNLRMQYVPINTRNLSTDIRIIAADAPMPVPIVIHGPARLAASREQIGRWVLTGPRMVDATAAADLPGVPDSDFLVDLEYADRLSESPLNLLRLEVWLNRSAPSDVVERLRAAGLVVIGDETKAQRAQRYSGGGAGLGQTLRLAGGLAGVVLAAVALLVVAAADRPRRTVELQALRRQGVAASVVRRASGGYGIIAAVALPAGLIAGLLAAQRPPGLVTLAAAFGLAVALLAVTARIAR